MSYATDLWDGTNIVSEKSRNVLKGSKGIILFFKDMSQLEEVYATSLMKASKTSKCDTYFSGTVGAAAMSVRSSAERMGMKHLKFSKDIVEHVCAEISKLEEELTENRKKLTSECQRLEKEMQNYSALLAKAKARQHKLAKEAHTLYLASKGQSPEPSLLLVQRPSSSRLQQAIKEAKVADMQYFDTVKQFNQFQKKYNEQMNNILEQFQNNDEKMLYVVKTGLLRFIELYENVMSDLMKDLAAMRHVSDAIDIDLDISHFITNYRTGKTPQTGVHYEPYNAILDDIVLGSQSCSIPSTTSTDSSSSVPTSPAPPSPAVPIASPPQTPTILRRRALNESGSIDESSSSWIYGLDTPQFGDMPLDDTPTTTMLANATIAHDYFSSSSQIRAVGLHSPRSLDDDAVPQSNDDQLASSLPLATSPAFSSAYQQSSFFFQPNSTLVFPTQPNNPTVRQGTTPPTHTSGIHSSSSSSVSSNSSTPSSSAQLTNPVLVERTSAAASVPPSTSSTENPPPDPDLPDSQQMIDLFTELLNVIITGHDISDELMRKAYRYLDSPEGRMAFALALNNQRTQKQLETHAFTTLAALVRLVVDKSYVTDDVRVSRLLMNMGQTFYRKRDNSDQYLQELIKDHPIWQDPRYWEGAFFDSLAETRIQQGLWDSKWKDLPEDLQAESILREENIVFGQLGSFAFNMLNMDNDLEMTRQFVRKMCMIHTINESYVRLLLENVERSHGELEAEKLKQDKEDWKRRQKIEWQRNRSRIQREAKLELTVQPTEPQSASSSTAAPAQIDTRLSHMRIGRAGVFFFTLPLLE